MSGAAWLAAAMLWVAATVAFAPGARAAEAPAIKTVTKKAAFDDVLFELNNAIIDRGLAIDHQGKIGEMLERTGSDVGSTKPIYKKAQFISFCSALLSRRMMEADPANIAYCPYVVFIYETVATPGEIIVGYRPPAPRGDEASRAALAEIDRLLGDIIADAVK